MTQECFINQLSDEECEEVVRIVKQKDAELKNTEYSGYIQNRFLESLNNKPNRMLRYLNAIDRIDS